MPCFRSNLRCTKTCTHAALCRWHWQLLIGGKVLTSFLVHMRYMLTVKFDYGWNMSICITLGICQGVAWILWGQLRRHPARYGTAASTLGATAQLSFQQ